MVSPSSLSDVYFFIFPNTNQDLLLHWTLLSFGIVSFHPILPGFYHHDYDMSYSWYLNDNEKKLSLVRSSATSGASVIEIPIFQWSVTMVVTPLFLSMMKSRHSQGEIYLSHHRYLCENDVDLFPKIPVPFIVAGEKLGVQMRCRCWSPEHLNFVR